MKSSKHYWSWLVRPRGGRKSSVAAPRDLQGLRKEAYCLRLHAWQGESVNKRPSYGPIAVRVLAECVQNAGHNQGRERRSERAGFKPQDLGATLTSETTSSVGLECNTP